MAEDALAVDGIVKIIPIGVFHVFAELKDILQHRFLIGNLYKGLIGNSQY